ncbi:HAD-IIA family hydrolase [Paenibacillus puerhi]|uniref:HAD-IIA family hydrolase n=1 Tax=Paenibacillus puerhi TaxID=2692622 RepID=UPI001915F48D|nr:HAD-IIA family hydrolase [Paenibacillus puerhi]
MSEAREWEGCFFDLDGTILLGDRLLPGAAETLAGLREQGSRVYFLSNTTTRTRIACRDRLRGMGLAAELEQVVTASYMAAVYLRETETASSVFVVGEPAMRAELEEQEVRWTEDPLEASHVLVGMDMHFDYRKLYEAQKAVRNGAVLVAANPDPYCPIEQDTLPDTWSMVKAIETAGGAAAEVVIGKPSAYYAAKVLEWSGLAASRCLMVGDRLETDILLGARHGMETALVLTGAATREDAERFHVKPDYIWSSLQELLTAVRP